MLLPSATHLLRLTPTLSRINAVVVASDPALSFVDEVSVPKLSFVDEMSAAALLAGTAIGGGFLALPHATAPAGALPSSVMLLCCWIFLLLQSFLVADLVIDDANAQLQANPNATVTTASFATLGSAAFGTMGGRAVSGTFVVLMLATLVSQISKGAELIAAAKVMPLSYGVLCALLPAAAAIFARLAPARLLGGVNGLLTAGFIASAGCLFGEGARMAGWQRLARADWSQCWHSLPTLLQLHVYSEIVPSICAALRHDRRRIRRSIAMGSVALLSMQLGWSTLGNAVSDFGGALRIDPVDALLSGTRGRVIAAATRSTAATAILTTILGTCVAANTFVADVLRQWPSSSSSSSSEAEEVEQRRGGRSARKAAALYAACVAVPALLAASTSSSRAFFGAIDWAGAYPVALLWGLAPPLMTLRMRKASKGKASRQTSPTLLLVALAALSAAFVTSNLAADAAVVLGLRRARWQ